VFLVGRAIGQVVVWGDISHFWSSFSDPHLAVALPFFALMAFAIQFVMQMNRMIGTNVLRYFATGAYRNPRDELRIFLFIDLEGSTQLAERLGSARYFAFLRRFVDDVSAAVLQTEGEIYQYVGDEVVATWPYTSGLRQANCVRCFFAVRDVVRQHAPDYVRAFGAVPVFRGGLHGGQVTGGELGDMRQQIVFVGDILNTAARLQEHAKRTGFDLVISDDLLAQLALPTGITTRRCGELALRGKGAPVTASSLSA
jgi:adenylate cyclase